MISKWRSLTKTSQGAAVPYTKEIGLQQLFELS